LQRTLTQHVKSNILKVMTTLVCAVHRGGRPGWGTTV